MNVYSTQFWATCPSDGADVPYALRIETADVIKVEEINAVLSEFVGGFHEDFADRLAARFGGYQRLNAEHQGVHIETQRGAKPCNPN